MPSRPLPIPTTESRQFWLAASEGRLALPYCPTCATYLYPPRSRCPNCLGNTFDWRPLSGKVLLNQWSEVALDVLPGVSPPFTVAEAVLTEQPNVVLIGLIDRGSLPHLVAGMAMRVGFQATNDPEIALPQFIADPEIPT